MPGDFRFNFPYFVAEGEAYKKECKGETHLQKNNNQGLVSHVNLRSFCELQSITDFPMQSLRNQNNQRW